MIYSDYWLPFSLPPFPIVSLSHCCPSIPGSVSVFRCLPRPFLSVAVSVSLTPSPSLSLSVFSTHTHCFSSFPCFSIQDFTWRFSNGCVAFRQTRVAIQFSLFPLGQCAHSKMHSEILMFPLLFLYDTLSVTYRKTFRATLIMFPLSFCTILSVLPS